MHSGYEVGFTAQSIAGPDYRAVAYEFKGDEQGAARLNLKVPDFVTTAGHSNSYSNGCRRYHLRSVYGKRINGRRVLAR